MPECPTFLKLPARAAKPRSRGITHVLDSGLTPGRDPGLPRARPRTWWTS